MGVLLDRVAASKVLSSVPHITGLLNHGKNPCPRGRAGQKKPLIAGFSTQ